MMSLKKGPFRDWGHWRRLEEIGGCVATLFETVVLIKDGEEGQIVDDTVFFDASKQQFPRMIV